MANHRISTLLLVLLGTLVHAQTSYSSDVDPHQAIEYGRTVALAEKKQLLLIFGADWCPDCQRFGEVLKDAEVERLVRDHFVLVKVDVGRFNKNLDLAKVYNVDPKRGIPGLSVVSTDGIVRYPKTYGEVWEKMTFTKETALAFLGQYWGGQ